MARLARTTRLVLALSLGFGAVASTTNLNQVTPPPPGNTPDPLWQHSPHVWLLDMGMQLVLTAILAGLTWWRLYQARPGAATSQARCAAITGPASFFGCTKAAIYQVRNPRSATHRPH